MPWGYVVTFAFGVLVGFVALSLLEIAVAGWEREHE